MNGPFVSLHNHTEVGSPLDGMNNVKDLFIRAKEVNHPAVAITDHGTMTAHYDAWKASQESGVRLIPGMEAYFADDLSSKKSYHLVLLARNANGYRNLLHLNFLAYQNQTSGYMGKKTPRIGWEHIEEFGDDLFCLTACSSGIVGRALITEKNEALAVQHIKRLHHIFGDRLRLEIQPHALIDFNKEGKETNQVKLNEGLIRLSHDLDIPYVITCDAHYRDKEAAKHHDLMLAIKDKKAFDDPDRFRYQVQDMYLKTEDEIVDFFGPKVARVGIRNSIEIMEACEEPTYLKPRGPMLPRYDMSDQPDYQEFSEWHQKYCSSVAEDKAYLRYKCMQGFKEKLSDLDAEDKKEYWERVKTELSVLEDKDFSSYMLIVADYINWAKERMPVGPARGSAAGSLVAYLVGITTVEPIRYGLIFERFHNNQKKSFPDIDTDFSKPAIVKEYIRDRYGEDRVASISNWSTLSPKVIIKDVARSLRLGGNKSTAFSIANKITDSMGDEKTVEDERKVNRVFNAYMSDNPDLFLYAQKLQNLTRNWSVHAAGVVIGEEPLSMVIPLRIEKKKEAGEALVVTQWEKTRCEDNGLIKMDILGLKTLTVIDEAFKIIKKTEGVDLTIEDIDLNDPGVYDMIGRGETSGVFQLESSLTPLCIKLRPRNIEDISVINAVGRPSCQPKERKKYIARRLGREEPTYIHESTRRALERTYGVLVYEEQAMFLAQDCAGWDLNQADALRKISKLKGKDPELVLRTEAAFLKDCMGYSGMTYEEASSIWRTFIEPLGKYAFNKSHSISYSHISFYTAWLRHHYPIQFMCALLNSENPNSEKAQEYLTECANMGIEVLPPSINSVGDYTASNGGRIMMGLGSMKGIGDSAILEIMAYSPYKNLKEFFAKTSGRTVNKRVVEALAKGGAFDTYNIPRKVIFENFAKYRTKVNNYLNKNKKAWLKANSDKNLSKEDNDSLAAAYIAENLDTLIETMPDLYDSDGYSSEDEWSKKEILINEQEALGRTISGSLHEVFKGFFRGNSAMVTPFEKIETLRPKSRIRIEAIVKSKIREFKIKNGNNAGQKFAKYIIEDAQGVTTTLTVWAGDYAKLKTVLTDGTPIKAICSVNEYMGKKDLALSTLEKAYGKGL
nr:DNA-directed DNA polymerase [bacterium]